MTKSTGITLFFLENSRAFRVARLLNELGLDHELKVYRRIEGKKAEPKMKEEAGHGLGKSPVLQDGDLTVVESEAIVTYLIERYGSDSGMLPSPPNWEAHTGVQAWMSFSEALMTHTLPVIYTRWFQPSSDDTEIKLSGNIHNDLDLLDARLASNLSKYGAKNGDGSFLCGDRLTAADIMCAFSAEYTLLMDAGISKAGATFQGQENVDPQGKKRWTNVESWLRGLEARKAYKDTIQAGATHKYVLP